MSHCSWNSSSLEEKNGKTRHWFQTLKESVCDSLQHASPLLAWLVGGRTLIKIINGTHWQIWLAADRKALSTAHYAGPFCFVLCLVFFLPFETCWSILFAEDMKYKLLCLECHWPEKNRSLQSLAFLENLEFLDSSPDWSASNDSIQSH